MTKLHKHIAGEEDSLAEDCSTPFRSNFSLNRFEMFADNGVSGAATGVKPESFRSALACPVSQLSHTTGFPPVDSPGND